MRFASAIGQIPRMPDAEGWKLHNVGSGPEIILTVDDAIEFRKKLKLGQ
jgi:hypothetical protein